jgi:hypothetical protein
MATRTQIDTFIQNHRNQLKALQDDYFALKRKYRQFKRGEYNEAVEVHEHVKPDGSAGYVIYIYAIEGADTYVKSFQVNLTPEQANKEWTLQVADELI